MGRRTTAVVLALVLLNLTAVSSAGSAEPSHGEQVERAIALVRGEPERFGVSAEDVGDLRVSSAYRSSHNGVTHVYLQQEIGGLEVAGSSITVNIGADGEVIHVGSRLVPGLDKASGQALIGAPAAARAAALALDIGPDSRASSPPELVYQPLEDGRIRLAWRLEIEERARPHWWNVTVDAETADLLVAIDYTDDLDLDHDHGDEDDRSPEDGSSYRVFALPLESPNDGERTLVESPADPVASPFGWHDTDGQPGPEHTTTRGNNVSAYIDTFNAGMPVPYVTEAWGGDDLTFDFDFDPSLPPTAFKDAAVTNLFYWNNIIHDVFYHYGFDEVAGNFQVSNYGRGGLGNDDVRAEAQDGSGTNNANFSTPPDGQRPRMQMYLWTTAAAARQEIIDGDFDNGVIIHEYGHGISHRLTGGPSTTSCLGHQERASEGWSDWLALALLVLPDENGEQPRGIGTYVLNQNSRRDRGIRPTAYSTNMAINPSTYDTIKTAAVPHGVGYVWSTMLWEVYWDLVAEHGFNPDVYEDWSTGGNNLAIQLVMDGMKFQPCSPGFVDARDAILAADVALTEGENQCVVWRGFAKRGLGYSADQGSPTSRADGTQAFDMPPECQG